MHSPELRHRAFFRYEKTLIKEGYSNKAIANARDNLAFECSTFPAEKSVENMLHHMAEMPKGKIKDPLITFKNHLRQH